MKTVFDKETRAELIARINTLNESSTAQWGKMNLYQMLKHCTLWEDLVWGRRKSKRAFMGYLFGKIALKSIIKDEAPLRRSTPTLPELMVKGPDGDIAAEKAKWVSAIEGYAHFTNPHFVHPFFGKMTEEGIGQLVYKHTDHHLRQFNG